MLICPPGQKPTYLANTTMETYIQTEGNTPPNPDTGQTTISSCIGCHVYGATLSGNDADFSLLFSKAKELKVEESN